jgi:folate-binding protein YgfZ
MVCTVLYDKLASSGAHMGSYCGAETALNFGDPRAEFAALVEDCGLYDLGWRARSRVSGRDRVRWLNGMVSNNIRELPAGRGNYNFVLNPQGHILGDLYVFNRGDCFLAETERAQFEKLLNLLRRYIIMDQVELADINEEFTGLGVHGPAAPTVLEKAGLEGPLPQSMELTEAVWNGHRVLVTRVENSTAPGGAKAFELWVAPSEASGLWEALAAAGAMPIGMEALEMFRVVAGIPRYGVDVRERDLPQETGQTQALNFAKGCYIGQEIVERIRSRGNVHRSFTGFVIEGAAPAVGSKVSVGGKEVGEITTALAVPESTGGTRVLALGYIRRESAKPGTEVEVQGAKAVVSELPFQL